MRYSASEKREIIDLVERSSLPVRRTLDPLGIAKSTYYGWYECSVRAAMKPWLTASHAVSRSGTGSRTTSVRRFLIWL